MFLSKAKNVLKKYWGYNEFRPLQAEIIQSVIDGKDTLALLPTGDGKSICFQVPALMLEGMCLVISPLIALMTDQVNQLKKRELSAAAILSGMSHREIDVLLDNCVLGKIKFLYVSPERLKSELFIERLKLMNVSILAIDEAHCISQWGYDFRPSYTEIQSVYPYIKGVKKIALTATATRDVRIDILEKLDFQEPVSFQKSFARKNFSYSAFNLENKGTKLLEILKNVGGSAIVYVKTRLETQNVAKFIHQNGISSDFYHGGLDPKTRATKQEQWINNVRRVMVATNAFGMGIDKPDVRVVVHLGLPDSLEAYYQEAGRAGRDERNAFAVILSSKTDVYNLLENEKRRNPELEYVQRIYQAIANYFKLATGSSEWQSYDFDLKQFSSNYNLNPRDAHYAIQKLEEMGLMLVNESFNRSSTLKFLLSQTELYKFNISNVGLEPLIKALLRLYGGALYNDFMSISEFELARLSGSSKSEVARKLNHLSQTGILIYNPMKKMPQLTYLTPRLEVSALKKPYNLLKPRRKTIKEKVEAMIAYVDNLQDCRPRVIQEYFDEIVYLNCGVCDICIKARKEEDFISEMDEAKNKIVELVKGGLEDIHDLKNASGITNDFLLTESIRILMDEDKMVMVGFNKLTSN